MTIYNSILETVGNTPLIKLQKLSPKGINIFVKVEAFNPMGSVKDRMAKAVIEHAEKTGELKPGQTVIEATSGNTGISLAMVCAQKGYPLIVTMAENFSVERRKLLRFLGAKVVLTPASEKGTGMLKKAQELAEKFGFYLSKQFENEENANIHTKTTAQEIIEDFKGKKLDYWVSGFGTGGTLLGTSKGLKNHDATIKVIAVEPDNSPLLLSKIPQAKDIEGNIEGSHPAFRPHLMQGWSPDFISKLTEESIELKLIDQIIPVSGNEMLLLSKRLAREEGILAGITSGATLAAAIEIGSKSKEGTNIVCMLPDTGERYLSTPLFDDISIDMNSEENSLSCSTPGYQFKQATKVADDSELHFDEQVNEGVVELVDRVISVTPVVIFSLEWCEFCWSARKLFKALNIEYTSIDLDSVKYQQNNMGGEIRKVLKNKIQQPTIPQIFIAGEHIGGASDLFSACTDKTLFNVLDKNDIPHNRDENVDINQFLPSWLHPRENQGV